MTERMNNECLCAWQEESSILSFLRDLGFGNTQEILDMRIYDLLNVNGMHGNRTEEVLLTLYRMMNESPLVDRAMDACVMDQPFPLGVWRKQHRTLGNVTVRELVLESGINRRAVEKLFAGICRAFYRSDEYNPRSYRYRDRTEYMEYRKREDGIDP